MRLQSKKKKCLNQMKEFILNIFLSPRDLCISSVTKPVGGVVCGGVPLSSLCFKAPESPAWA